MVSRMIARGAATLFLGLCLPMHAWALGLGDIQLDSHLNEKFRATIELYDAEGLQSSEIIVSLASREDFDRVGVERFFFLTGLRFSVEMIDGEPTIAVTSAQPISEPYLNFLVEVLWPQGRLLKEYTVLLDPPTYSATVAPPQQEDRDTVARAAPPQPRDPPPRVDRGPSRGTQVTLADRGAPAGSTNMTTRNDTLWSIANRNRPGEVSVNQYMLAIQRANPEAFINGNINLIKAGYVLRMPSRSDALELSGAQANAEVSRQTDVWRGISRPVTPTQVADTSGPVLRQQVDTTQPAAPARAVPADASSGTLQIVAGEGDVAQGSTGEGVAQVQEENERLSREVDELTYQLDREREQATDQIAVRERRLEVQDQQMAALRQELERAQAELEAIRANPQSPQQSRPVADEGTPFWASPSALLIAGAAALVLALIGAVVFMRRRQAASQEAVYQAAVDQDDTAAGFAIGDVSDDQDDDDAGSFALTSDDEDDDDEDALDLLQDLDDDPEFAAESASEEEAPAPPSLQTSDVIGEADIYAAYGRYPHAIGLLTGALEEDENRHDVRLKLLEVCVAAEDHQTFNTHLSELVERCSDQDILLAARELEESMPDGDGAEESFGGDTAGIAAGVVAAGAAVSALADDDDEDEAFLEDHDEPAADDLLAEAESLLDDAELDDVADLDDLADADDLLSGAESLLDDDELSVDDDEVPQLDDLDALESEVDDLLSDLDTGDDESSDEYQLDFDDEEEQTADTLGELGGAVAAADDLEADDVLAFDADEADDDFSLELDAEDDESYESLDDLLAEGSADEDAALGGDLGLDFDPDSTDEAGGSEDNEAGQLMSLGEDDDLEIEDLLAELDADGDLLGEADDITDDDAGDFDLAAAGGDDNSAEILSFSRPEDGDVPTVETVDTSGGPLGGVVEDDDAFDDDDVFVDDADAADTKLDLAQAYIDMGDEDGARDILGEVLQEGTDAQKDTAQNLLDSLAS